MYLAVVIIAVLALLVEQVQSSCLYEPEPIATSKTPQGQVTIPSSVSNIKGDDFNGCTTLRSIKIPSSVQVIETRAFRGVTDLVEVDFDCTSSSVMIQPNASENSFPQNSDVSMFFMTSYLY